MSIFHSILMSQKLIALDNQKNLGAYKMLKSELKQSLQIYKEEKFFFRPKNIRIKWLIEFLQSTAIAALPEDQDISFSSFTKFIMENNKRINAHIYFTEKYLNSGIKSEKLFREWM